ncbi:hypothetical protein KY347_05710 [Candidatus Woesearchaeota archaeon]|nr:hypothetical protein [Candidatus Woesearchaeota archaeon]
MTEEKSHEHEGHHEHKLHHAEHKKQDFTGKIDVWKIATALAVLLLVVSVFTGGFKGNKGGVAAAVSPEEATQKALDFINDNLLQPGISAELKGVSESNGVYSIDISVEGQDFTSYVTQDGKMLFVSGIDMTQEIEDLAETEEEPEEVTKSDKPEVELFVMSHCPYGTQAEKGIIPAVEALGDSIDFRLRFVSYAMHGEKEVKEQANQYCIQKEQKDKLLGYLACFLKEGDGEACLEEAKIDLNKMNSCVEEADKQFEITANLEDESKWLNGRFPQFSVDADLNSQYGVSGSPTLVINGMKMQSSRDSASYLKTICASFNEEPETCTEELSSAAPSPGFGYTESEAAATEAQCG